MESDEYLEKLYQYYTSQMSVVYNKQQVRKHSARIEESMRLAAELELDLELMKISDSYLSEG